MSHWKLYGTWSKIATKYHLYVLWRIDSYRVNVNHVEPNRMKYEHDHILYYLSILNFSVFIKCKTYFRFLSHLTCQHLRYVFFHSPVHSFSRKSLPMIIYLVSNISQKIWVGERGQKWTDTAVNWTSLGFTICTICLRDDQSWIFSDF